jgi:hypothetical protein
MMFSLTFIALVGSALCRIVLASVADVAIDLQQTALELDTRGPPLDAENASLNLDGELTSRTSTTDPSDFSWIRNWVWNALSSINPSDALLTLSQAAIGDSFTAGVGSGTLYSTLSADKSCSRYDWTYPVILNRFFGPSVQNFIYVRPSSNLE